MPTTKRNSFDKVLSFPLLACKKYTKAYFPYTVQTVVVNNRSVLFCAHRYTIGCTLGMADWVTDCTPQGRIRLSLLTPIVNLNGMTTLDIIAIVK